jgi:hypothetical protein
VSEAGRPQFLPPEEPPVAPPPMPPPAPPQRDARGPIIAAAVAVALLLIAGLGVLIYQGGQLRPVAGPSAQPSTSPSSSMPVYTTLPNPCTAPGNAVPADVRSVKPHNVADSCHWQILRPDRSRYLTVEVTLEKDEDFSGTGTDKAAKDFADDLAYAGDSVQNGGFVSDPVPLSGLGDEAFAARSFNLIEEGPTKRTATSYDMGGAQVEARRRNVVVTVKWQGGDYPPSVRGKKKLAGRQLPYAQAKQQALAIVQAVLATLG